MGQLGTDWDRMGQLRTSGKSATVGDKKRSVGIVDHHPPESPKKRQEATKVNKRRQLGTSADNWRQESQRRAARVEVVRLVLEHKERWRGIACFWCQVRRNEIATLWRFFGSCATNAPQAKVRGIEHAKAQNRAQSGISDGEILAADTVRRYSEGKIRKDSSPSRAGGSDSKPSHSGRGVDS